MAKFHHSIQKWNQWLTEPLGTCLLQAEQDYLLTQFAHCYGSQALLIGVPSQADFLKLSSLINQTLVTPLFDKSTKVRTIEGEFRHLPIISASIDAVILPHALELIDNPHALLREACRVVKPEGHIIIFGFNPYHFWDWKKKTRYSVPANKVKEWLTLVDFELIKQDTFLFRPPLQNKNLYKKLKWVEWLGRNFFAPFGSVYMLMAKAKVIPLTPIKLHWKQSPSCVQVTFPGPSIRNSR